MGCRCLLGTLVWCGFDEVWESTVWLCFVFFLFASTPLVASCSCARAGVCRVVPPAPPAAGYRERAAAPDETGARVAPQRNVHHGGGGGRRAQPLCGRGNVKVQPPTPPPPRLHCGGSALLPPLLPPPRPNAAPDTPRAHLLACTPQPHQPCGASPAPPPTQHIHTTQPAGVRPPAPPFPRERRPRRQPHQQPAGSPAWPPAGGGGGGGTDATRRALLATRGGGVVAGADLGPVDHIPDGRQVGHLVVLVLQVKRVLSGEKRAGSQGTDGREAGRKQQRDRRRTAGWRKTREGTGGCPRGQSASQPRWRPQPAATAVGCHRAAPTR